MTDQAQDVYAAEALWRVRDFQASIRFGDWNEVWPFYYKLATKFREAGRSVQAPQVKSRKGALKAHYDTTTQTVFLPPYGIGGVWALNTGVAIHEFAHHLAPNEGHGPGFRQAMLNCLDVLGWDASVLEQCYAEVGLTASAKGDSITDKVGKLLTHAAGASTEEERNVFLSKAESLASTHSINLALVRKRQADANDASRSRPTTGTMFSLQALPNQTYRKLAVSLANEIAHAHGARCTVHGKSTHVVFYGFPEDIALTELMVARLTPMMFSESDAYLHSREHRESGVAGVSARITFCGAFTREVGRRLQDAVDEAQSQAVDAYEEDEATGADQGSSMALAIAEKAVEVADYVEYEFKRRGVRGSWTGSRTSNWSYSASKAGATAGKQANIFGRKELS